MSRSLTSGTAGAVVSAPLHDEVTADRTTDAAQTDEPAEPVAHKYYGRDDPVACGIEVTELPAGDTALFAWHEVTCSGCRKHSPRARRKATE